MDQYARIPVVAITAQPIFSLKKLSSSWINYPGTAKTINRPENQVSCDSRGGKDCGLPQCNAKPINDAQHIMI